MAALMVIGVPAGMRMIAPDLRLTFEEVDDSGFSVAVDREGQCTWPALRMVPCPARHTPVRTVREMAERGFQHPLEDRGLKMYPVNTRWNHKKEVYGRERYRQEMATYTNHL